MSELFNALKTNVKGIASDFQDHAQKRLYEKEKENFDSL